MFSHLKRKCLQTAVKVDLITIKPSSLLLSMGVSMKEIQAWLGHSTYETTANIYSHLDPTAKFNTASAIVGMFGTKENIEEQERIRQNAINKIDEERNLEKARLTTNIEKGINEYQKEESIEEIDEEIAMLELKLAEKRKARLLKNEQDEM